MEKNCKTCELSKTYKSNSIHCRNCKADNYSRYDPMYPPPAEKVERFEKVEVKTEDDLPKVAGSYIACLRNGSIYEDYKFIGIDNTFPDTNHWMRHIKWWLRPVK